MLLKAAAESQDDRIKTSGISRRDTSTKPATWNSPTGDRGVFLLGYVETGFERLRKLCFTLYSDTVGCVEVLSEYLRFTH